MSKASILRRPPLPDSLYHYTNAAGFLGILRSSRLWATHAGYLNDRLEIDHAARMVTEVLEQRKKGITSKVLSRFLDKAVSDFNLYEDTFFDAYIISFCENPDLLSQWRGYGATGGGFAIGLKPDNSNRTPVFSPDQHFILLKNVVYDKAKQSSVITSTIDKIISLFQRSISSVRNADVNRVILRFTRFLQQELAVYLVTFKDPAFAEEREWRLISLADFQFPHFRDQLTFRAGNNLLIPYYELNLSPLLADKDGKLSINAIVIGPTLEEGLTTQSIAMAVTAYGYYLPNIDVRQSVVPLRF